MRLPQPAGGPQSSRQVSNAGVPKAPAFDRQGRRSNPDRFGPSTPILTSIPHSLVFVNGRSPRDVVYDSPSELNKDEPMSWVRAGAYKNGQFLLERLLSQVASDVHEANRLPLDVRQNRRFHIERKPDRFDVCCTVGMESFAIVHFFAEVAKVRCGGMRMGVLHEAELAAEWDADAEEERWSIQRPSQPPEVDRSIAEVSREVLERFMFDT